MENHTIVTLKKGEGRTIKAGGAWIFDNEIDTIVGTFTNGDVVTEVSLLILVSWKFTVREETVWM